MDLTLPKLYAITDRSISGLSHAEQVAGFCRGGARLIQLREKELPNDEFYRQALEAVTIARQFGATLLINDRVDIVMAVGADGVHLGQTDLPATAARQLLGESAIIGFSTHNRLQIEESNALPVDYVGYGPVFETRSKVNPDPAVGLNGVTCAKQELARSAPPRPLVAIGGIQSATAKAILAAGADSVAVIRAIAGSSEAEIARKTSQFLSIIENSA